MLTDFQAKALTIIRDKEGIHARELGIKLWPDSPARKRSYRCGASGSARGTGLWLSAGSYVGKLWKKGFVKDHMVYGLLFGHGTGGGKWGYHSSGYELTEAGRTALEEYEKGM